MHSRHFHYISCMTPESRNNPLSGNCYWRQITKPCAALHELVRPLRLLGVTFISVQVNAINKTNLVPSDWCIKVFLWLLLSLICFLFVHFLYIFNLLETGPLIQFPLQSLTVHSANCVIESQYSVVLTFLYLPSEFKRLVSRYNRNSDTHLIISPRNSPKNGSRLVSVYHRETRDVAGKVTEGRDKIQPLQLCWDVCDNWCWKFSNAVKQSAHCESGFRLALASAWASLYIRRPQNRQWRAGFCHVVRGTCDIEMSVPLVPTAINMRIYMFAHVHIAIFLPLWMDTNIDLICNRLQWFHACNSCHRNHCPTFPNVTISLLLWFI
jgi:hypothetical protein